MGRWEESTGETVEKVALFFFKCLNSGFCKVAKCTIHKDLLGPSLLEDSCWKCWDDSI